MSSLVSGLPAQLDSRHPYPLTGREPPPLG